jgi:hypothetical protein
MKLLLNICIYFIILLILYNIFDYLFSQNIIEPLNFFEESRKTFLSNYYQKKSVEKKNEETKHEYTFDTYTVPELQQKCKTKILKKHDAYETRVEKKRSCFWTFGNARKRCHRDNNAKKDRNNARNARNINRTNKINGCLSSYTYSGFQKGYTDKTVYSEINNSHIVTEPPHSGEDPFKLGEELVKSDVVNAVHNDDSMNTALTTMIDTEIDNGLNYENYKTKYKTKLTENLKEKYKEQESQRRTEFVDVNDDLIIGNEYDPAKGSLLINDGNEQYSEVYMGADDGQMQTLNTIKEDVYGRSNAKFKDKYQTQANSYLTDWAEKIGALLKEKLVTTEDINAGVQT